MGGGYNDSSILEKFSQIFSQSIIKRLFIKAQKSKIIWRDFYWKYLIVEQKGLIFIFYTIMTRSVWGLSETNYNEMIIIAFTLIWSNITKAIYGRCLALRLNTEFQFDQM